MNSLNIVKGPDNNSANCHSPIPPYNLSDTDRKVYQTRKRKAEEVISLDDDEPQLKKSKTDSTKYSVSTSKGTIEITYPKKSKEGDLIEKRFDGSTLTCKVVNNVREGLATLTDKNGKLNFTYKQGLKEGPATYELSNGITLNFSFSQNQLSKHGTATYNGRTVACKTINGVLKAQQDINLLFTNKFDVDTGEYTSEEEEEFSSVTLSPSSSDPLSVNPSNGTNGFDNFWVDLTHD